VSFTSEPTPVDKHLAQQMTNGGSRFVQTNMINGHCSSLSKFEQLLFVLSLLTSFGGTMILLFKLYYLMFLNFKKGQIKAL
jgi:hypothetical protein